MTLPIQLPNHKPLDTSILLGNLWIKRGIHRGTPTKPQQEYSWSLATVSLPLLSFCILLCSVRVIQELLHFEGKFTQTIWWFLSWNARKANWYCKQVIISYQVERQCRLVGSHIPIAGTSLSSLAMHKSLMTTASNAFNFGFPRTNISTDDQTDLGSIVYEVYLFLASLHLELPRQCNTLVTYEAEFSSRDFFFPSKHYF